MLSLIFFYRLALELTGRPRLALLAGLLLALNPLHAFFSRFPVTEIPTLSFTLAGFWLILAAWHRREDDGARSKVLLSLIAFACAFLIRITGFMYVPIFVVVGLLAAAYITELKYRRLIFCWAFGVLMAYSLTVLYGLVFSHIYTSAVYQMSFEPLLGAHWRRYILVASVSIILLLGLLYNFSHHFRIAAALRWAAEISKRYLGLAVLVSLVPWASRLYSVGFTSKYASDPWLADRWHMAGSGFGILKHSSLVVAAEYLGPFLVMAFFILAWKRQLSPPTSMLLAFVAFFLFYICALQWQVPYQPYYARYLISEFVPYLILFVVAASGYLVGRSAKNVCRFAFALTLIYGGLLSVGQLRAHEQRGMAQSYARIAQHVGDGDLMLLDVSSLALPDQLIEMPFMLRYNRNVAEITENSINNSIYLNSLQRHYDNLFLLSGNVVPPAGFTLVDSVRMREFVASQGSKPPLSTQVRFDGRTFLYVRHGMSIIPRQVAPLGSTANWRSTDGWHQALLRGWSNPEPWGVWTDGLQARMHLPARLSDGSKPTDLKLTVRGFLTTKHKQQRVHVSVNGEDVFDTVLTFASSGNTELSIPLPSNVSDRSGYDIDFELPDAASPSELGMGGDTRKLGIGVISALLITNP